MTQVFRKGAKGGIGFLFQNRNPGVLQIVIGGARPKAVIQEHFKS